MVFGRFSFFKKSEKRSHVLLDFPDEVLLHILLYVDAESLGVLARVNFRFNSLCEDSSIWRRIFKTITLEAPVSPSRLGTNWKERCRRAKQLAKCWDALEVKSREVLIGHSDFVSTIAVHNDRVVSGSFDGSISLWSLAPDCQAQSKPNSLAKPATPVDVTVRPRIARGASTSQPQLCIDEAHDDILSRVRFDGNRIISCSRDATIKTWDAETGALLDTLRLHGTSSVRCLQVYGRKMVSGGEDNRVVLFDLDTRQSCELYKHESVVTCVQIDADANVLMSGSRDNTVILYDLVARKEIKVLRGHKDSITCFSFNDEWIVTGSRDKCVRIWSRKHLDLRHVIMHTNWIGSLCLGKTRVFANCIDDGTVCVYSLKTGQRLGSLEPHQKLIRGMHLDAHRLITGSNDGTIAVSVIAGPDVVAPWHDETECQGSASGSKSRTSSMTVNMW
eukprot:Opistho-2@35649